MKRQIEKNAEGFLEQFDEDVRVSDLDIREDSEGNFYAVGPNRETALRIFLDEGSLRFEETVVDIERTDEVPETEGLEETDYYLEKKESSDDEGVKLVVVEPIQRGDEHVFF